MRTTLPTCARQTMASTLLVGSSAQRPHRFSVAMLEQLQCFADCFSWTCHIQTVCSFAVCWKQAVALALGHRSGWLSHSGGRHVFWEWLCFTLALLSEFGYEFFVCSRVVKLKAIVNDMGLPPRGFQSSVRSVMCRTHRRKRDGQNVLSGAHSLDLAGDDSKVPTRLRMWWLLLSTQGSPRAPPMHAQEAKLLLGAFARKFLGNNTLLEFDKVNDMGLSTREVLEVQQVQVSLAVVGRFLGSRAKEVSRRVRFCVLSYLLGLLRTSRGTSRRARRIAETVG